jgi:hypothetical protein
MRVEDTPAVAIPILTNHARDRLQGRGVPTRIVKAIYANADRSPFVGSGCRSLIVSRRQLDRLVHTFPRLIVPATLLRQDDRRRLLPRLDLLGGKIGRDAVQRVRGLKVCLVRSRR